ncbi:MAG: hypothetical protein AAF763_05980 [Pseudomonadota bacterium]
MIRFLRSLSLVVLAATALLAAGPASADLAKARTLMELARIDAVLARISAQGRRGWREQTGQLPEQVVDVFTAAWDRHFDPADMAEEMTGDLAEGLSQAQLDALIADFSTPAARRVTALEAVAQAPDRAAERAEDAGPMLDRLRDRNDPRLAVMTRMIEATNAVDIGVSTSLNMIYALLSAIMGSDRFPQVLDEAQLLAVVGGMEPQLRMTTELEVARSMAFTYRDLSMAELEAYAERLEGPLLQPLNEVFSNALEGMLVERSRRFGEEAMEATGARDI